MDWTYAKSFNMVFHIWVSINTIQKEAHLLSFHGRVAVHKISITESIRTASLRWCKVRRQSAVQLKRVLWSDEPRFIL